MSMVSIIVDDSKAAAQDLATRLMAFENVEVGVSPIMDWMA